MLLDFFQVRGWIVLRVETLKDIEYRNTEGLYFPVTTVVQVQSSSGCARDINQDSLSRTHIWHSNSIRRTADGLNGGSYIVCLLL